MTAAEIAARLREAGAGGGLFLDFDGTLAPIVEDPERARMPEDLRPVLERLASRLGVVAVVSGRPASVLAERALVPGVLLLGLYGLEEWRDGSVHPRPEAARWQAALERAKERLFEAFDGRPGLFVEDKGLGVAVHWRNAPDRAEAARAVAELVAAVAAQTGLGRGPGKFVEELRPPVDWDKGSAVEAVADAAGLVDVVYVGDDLGDLSAFHATQRRGGAALLVEHAEETPAELAAVADAVLAGTAAVHDWLRGLAEVT